MWTVLLSCAWAQDGKGVPPAAPQAAPQFQAVAHTGAPRSRADLIGHPTVLWFFPIVGTPG